MCIVTGPNIDFATKLIRQLKNIFKRKLGLTFTDKETVLQLNGFRIEAHWRSTEGSQYQICTKLTGYRRLCAIYRDRIYFLI